MKQNAAIAGDLTFINLSEVFQLLGANGSTGALHIMSKYSETPGIIYFQKGNPVDATAGSVSGLDAVYSLFGWIEGQFEFVSEPVSTGRTIKKSRMEIILDCTKMLEEGLIEKLSKVSFEKNIPEDSEDNSVIPVVKGPLVDYMYVADEEDHHKGDIIFKQGRHGNWSWVVLDGILEIRRETPAGQIPIVRVGAGAFVGSIDAFLSQSSVRSYTVVAITDVQLGVLDSQRLSQENALFSGTFRSIIKSIDKRLKQSANLICDIQQNKKKPDDFLSDKEQIVKQGEKKSEVSFIEQGSVCITRKTNKGQLLLARLDDGDFIGPLPFLDLGQEPHLASVYASEDLGLTPVGLEELQKEYNRLSATMKNFIENTSVIIATINQMAYELG